MKYYLDTNAIYNISNIPSDLLSKSLISCLGIFELISGIKNEKSFLRRRGVIRKVVESEIVVIWELPKTITERAFSYPLDYSDVNATKMMMEKIVCLESFDALQDVKFTIEDKEYSINTFNDYDHWFSSTTTDLFNNIESDEKISEKDRRALIQLTSEFTLERFISSRGVEFQRPSEKYFDVLKKYLENPVLKKYIKFLSAYSIENYRLGKVAGRNDGFDIGHVAYMHEIDCFVSNDKIYNEFLSEYANINTLSFDDFLEKV